MERTIRERLKSAGSGMPAAASLTGIYEHIRMLDAKGQPRAFIEWAGFCYPFTEATQRDGHIKADFTIMRTEEAD